MAKNLKRKLLFGGAIALLLIIIAGASAVIWYQVSLMPVKKCDGICPTEEFVVAEGEGASKIAANLEKQGFIKSAFAFKIYHSMFAGNKAMMPGTYQFAKDMDVRTIVQSLYEGVAAKVFRITFLPGETIAASKKKLIAVGYSAEDIEAAFAKKYTHKLLESKPDDASLEGYIWGDTYEFYQTNARRSADEGLRRNVECHQERGASREVSSPRLHASSGHYACFDCSARIDR